MAAGAVQPPDIAKTAFIPFLYRLLTGFGLLDDDVISAGRQLVDPPEYSAGTFFGTLDPVLSDRVANVTMATEVPRGAGRIALWSDSTLFSNFSIFVPGKMEVALNTIDWLNRENFPLNVRMLLLGVGVALIVVSARYARIDSWLFLSLVAITTMPPLLNLWTGWMFPPLSPTIPFETMAFYEPELTQHLPIAITDDVPTPYGYLSTFVAIQRAGKRPVLANEVETIGTMRQAVYIPTQNGLPANEFDHLLTWIKGGGILYILDGGLSPSPQLARFAQAGGGSILPVPKTLPANSATPPLIPLFVDGDPVAKISVTNNGKAIGSQVVSGYIRGGKSLLQDASNNQPIASDLPLGKGHLILTTTLFMFSDQSLGDVKAIPTDTQLAVYQLLFQWYGMGHSHIKLTVVPP